MALTASRTSKGFEFVYNKMQIASNPTMWELTPNTAFSKGDLVVLTAGKVAKAAASAVDVLGVIDKTFTTTTNPAAATTLGPVRDNPFDVFRCTFAGHRDATATGGSTTTLVDTAISESSDDDWNGALLYIYEGTNAGHLRTVTDYTGSSDTLTVTEPYPAACDTTSKYILLGVGAAGDVINIGSTGVDIVDENTIDSNAVATSDAGPLVVMPTPLDDIKNLMLHVMIRKHRLNGI